MGPNGRSFTPRQEQLLAAAARVVAHGGLRRLTHRAVDTEAGLPQGSCSAYMRTRLSLLTWLTEYVAAHFSRDIAALTSRIEEHLPAQDDREGYAVQQTAALMHSWVRDPELLLVRLELTIEGSREPAIAELLQAQSQQLVQVVEHAPDAAGQELGRVRAVTLIAALDGVLLRALREDATDRTRFMSESVELLLRTLAGTPGAGTA